MMFCIDGKMSEFLKTLWLIVGGHIKTGKAVRAGKAGKAVRAGKAGKAVRAGKAGKAGRAVVSSLEKYKRSKPSK